MTITDADICVIWASDGVWEFVSSREAAHLAAACQDATQACRVLTDVATERWAEHEPDVSDDISCVVVFFNGKAGRTAAAASAAAAPAPAASSGAIGEVASG